MSQGKRGARKGPSRSGTMWTSADYQEAGFRQLRAWLPAELVQVIDDYAALQGKTRTAVLTAFAEGLQRELERNA